MAMRIFHEIVLDVNVIRVPDNGKVVLILHAYFSKSNDTDL